MSLFESLERKALASARPLAARMRPQSLDEFCGQQHILGADGLLRRLIRADRLGSIILYGPPGTGKTTLARLLASETRRRFQELNAVLHGVKELREILEQAREELATGGPGTLLFVDEIHRFNKAQQDAMMSDVEQGIVTLVGATTSNPFFAVNPALVSRSQIFQFEPLAESDIVALLRRALSDRSRGLGMVDVRASDDALNHIAAISDGDARRALGILEIAVTSNQEPVFLDRELLDRSIAGRAIRHDRGDDHYDLASALIKSIRGSDADAAVYWLARMLAAGEDIRFLCRRLVILASEDIGNADPNALPLAVSCFQACEFVGLPECQLILSQTVAFLALAPKSNAATTAIGAALKDVSEERIIPVPRSLRDSHYQGGKTTLGHGEGYVYAHDSPDGIAAMDFLGVDRHYYHPAPRGFEAELADRIEKARQILGSVRPAPPDISSKSGGESR